MSERISPRLLLHPVDLLALGFGSGLLPKAPGTAGTLAAVPVYLLVQPLAWPSYLALTVLLFVAGIAICAHTAARLGVHDHPGIVWDEIVAFLLVLFFTPPGFLWGLLAFSLFRFFDIVKPPPIRYYDMHWHGGLGVMFDDLLAAGYTLLCLALVKSLLDLG